MDIVTKETRSKMMAGIKGKNTGPEMLIRSALHRKGFRFRLHAKELFGKPDLVLPKYRACIFVHGCFWHRHKGCKLASVPKSRQKFWAKKFDSNVQRDVEAICKLRKAGWRVAVVWECSIRREPDATICRVEDWILSAADYFEWPLL